MKLLPGMHTHCLEFEDRGGWREAVLHNPDDTIGVRFSIMHMPTCFRRGPYKLLIEVLSGEFHNNWGCFDEQDMPARYYHDGHVAVLEATAIANVLMANFEAGKDRREIDMAHIHKSRQMFAYHNGGIILAEIGDKRSHEDWFKSFPEPLPYETTPRGFVRANIVAIYVGSTFQVPQNWELVARALEETLPAGKYDLLLGMIPAVPGEKWRPQSVLKDGINAGQKFVRVHLTHSYIAHADSEDMIELAKDAICDDLMERKERRGSIKVEPAPHATDADVPEFLTQLPHAELGQGH